LETLVESCSESQRRVAEVDGTETRINGLLSASNARISQLMASGAFLEYFPGDRLLRAFAGLHHIAGEHFRNACLDAAQRLNVRPEAMEVTLQGALL